MSQLDVIERMGEMLRTALEIIREQASLLELHGIATYDRQLERSEQKLQDDAKGILGDGKIC